MFVGGSRRNDLSRARYFLYVHFFSLQFLIVYSHHSTITSYYLLIAKAVSRSKQLQLYKGNWATIEIMKTLIKNRRCYRSRIGTFDKEQEIKKEESQDEESDQEGSNVDDGNNGYSDGNNGDDWDDMYMPEKKGDEDNNGRDGGEDNGAGGSDGDDEDEDVNVNGSEDDGSNGTNGGEVEDENGGDINGGEDEDGNMGKEINGGHGKVGEKGNEGRVGMKRKFTPVAVTASTATRVKKKMDDSKGAQSKKIQLKRKGKKHT